MISLPSNVDNKISSAIRYCANIHLCINFTQFEMTMVYIVDTNSCLIRHFKYTCRPVLKRLPEQ